MSFQFPDLIKAASDVVYEQKANEKIRTLTAAADRAVNENSSKTARLKAHTECENAAKRVRRSYNIAKASK